MLVRKKNRAIGEYLTVQEASDLIGVSPSTLRNWDRAGKLKARRNPVNGYRLYAREELEQLLKRVKGTLPRGV